MPKRKSTVTKREKILQILKNYGQIKPKELVEFSGIAERTVRDNIKKLEKEGLIRVVGETSERYYELIEDDNKPKEIFVILEGHKVGTLLYGNGQHRFIYDKKYKGKPLPGLDKGSENVSADLYPEFENLLPENQRREVLLQKYSEPADILAHVTNHHGAYDFFTPEQYEAFDIDYSRRPNYNIVKKEILGANQFPNLMDTLIDISDEVLDSNDSNYSGLSGYQNKVDVTFEDNKIIRAIKNPDYLLKPVNLDWSTYFKRRKPAQPKERDYYPYVALNEHLFMTFAKNELGFDVPYTGVIWDEKRKDFHYITKRYDRFRNWKYQQRDFGQIMGYTSDNKYIPTSEKLFDAIAANINSALDKSAREDFLSFYYFSYVLKHTDLHVKNISVINVGTTAKSLYQLSPLYDIISVGVYNGKSQELGLSLNGTYKNRKERDFHGLAERLEIPIPVFEKRAEWIRNKFKSEFPKYVKAVEGIEKTIKLKYSMSRTKKIDFSQRLRNFYNERLVELKIPR